MEMKREQLPEHEIRMIPVEIAHLRAEKRESGEMIAEGTAIVYNEVVDIWGDEEVILSGAATESLAEDDIRAVWNHRNEIVLGRKSAKTLELSEDKKGVHVLIRFPDSEEGRNKFESVRRGDVTQMSFAFDALEWKWDIRQEDGKEIWRREISKLKIFEVSPVTFPMYETTKIEARCKDLALRGRPEGAAAPEDPTAVVEVLKDARENLEYMRRSQ